MRTYSVKKKSRPWNQLLILVLESTPVANRALERFVTSPRATMLERLTCPDPFRHLAPATGTSCAVRFRMGHHNRTVNRIRSGQISKAREFPAPLSRRTCEF